MIDTYLLTQQGLFPQSTPQDILKHCYQAAFGAEHLLGDMDAARAYFHEEYASLAPAKAALCQPLSEEVCRADMAAWKAAGLPEDWLFNLFRLSASVRNDGKAVFEEYISRAEGLCKSGAFSFSAAKWDAYLKAYREKGMPPLRHSDTYRAAYKPAYRIVSTRLARLIPILEAAAKSSARPCIISIEGRAASGKSSMAAALSDVLGCGTVHMDDFFLPPTLRSPARYAEAGGNVHYERFIDEVLPRLRDSEGFSYRRFDCSLMDFGELRQIKTADFVLVEGSYSLHPRFGDYADVRVFSDVAPDEQLRRIVNRDGADYAEVFKSRWIPLEEAYFSAFPIENALTV